MFSSLHSFFKGTGRESSHAEQVDDWPTPVVVGKKAGKGKAPGLASDKRNGSSAGGAPAAGSLTGGAALVSGNNLARAGDSSGDLVSFLQQTGSILALAEMLDDADDDVTDEDMRLLQEAASKQATGKRGNGRNGVRQGQAGGVVA